MGLERMQSSGRRSTWQCECLKLQPESLAVSSWPFEPYRGRHREVCKPVLHPHKPSTAAFSVWHEHSDEKYTSHGKLSKEKLQLLDSEYHDAVEHGLWWDVISAEVLGKFPSLPTMLQACYNTGAQLQRKETELQLARRILALWQQKSPCMRTKPACADSLPRMYQFILKFGGGSTATWLMETEEICRSFPPRTLGPDFWVNVSKDLKTSTFWRCRHATIQLGYIAPDKLIGANDVKKLFSASMIPTLQKAETMLESMRSKAKAANVTDFTQVHAFERSVIAVLLEKKHAEVTRVSSIEAAAAL